MNFFRRFTAIITKKEDCNSIELSCITQSPFVVEHHPIKPNQELPDLIDHLIDSEFDITNEMIAKLKANYRGLSKNYIDKCIFLTHEIPKTFHPLSWMSNLTPFGWRKGFDKLYKMDWFVYRERNIVDFFGENRLSYGKLVASDGISVIPFEIFKEAFPWFVHGDINDLLDF